MGSWVRLGRGFSLYLLYRNRYFFCRTFNVHEVLSMLEDVGEFEEASIYIEPSPVAAITDEDSADEGGGGDIFKPQLKPTSCWILCFCSDAGSQYLPSTDQSQPKRHGTSSENGRNLI